MQPMKAATLVAVAMLLTMSLAAAAGGGGSVCARNSVAAMQMHLAIGGATIATRSEARDQQPTRCVSCGMLPEQPRGTNDNLAAPAAWKILDLPPPTQ